jgi:hypothetical protein
MNMTPEEERDALIDRYVNGKLTEEEEAEFEVRMMDEQELFDQVQMTRALKSGLQKHAESLLTTGSKNDQNLAAYGRGLSSGTVVPFKLWLRQPISLVASFLVGVLGVQVLYYKQSTTPDGEALAIGTTLLLETTRGDTAVAFTGPPPYLFQIDAGLENQANLFRVVIKDTTTGTTVVDQSELTSRDGWVRLVLSTAFSGEFQAELMWVNPDGTAHARPYFFRIDE